MTKINFADPEIKKWFDSQIDGLEELNKSKIIVSIVSPDYLKDPQCMMQIGASVFMNKPIVLIVLNGMEIPPKLFMIADKIIRSDSDKDSLEKASKEMAEFIKTLQ